MPLGQHSCAPSSETVAACSMRQYREGELAPATATNMNAATHRNALRIP